MYLTLCINIVAFLIIIENETTIFKISVFFLRNTIYIFFFTLNVFVKIICLDFYNARNILNYSSYFSKKEVNTLIIFTAY